MHANDLDHPDVLRLNRLAKLPPGTPKLGEVTDECQVAKSKTRMHLTGIKEGKLFSPRLHSVAYQYFVEGGDWLTLEKRASDHRCPKSAELSKQGLICLNPKHLVNRKRAAEEDKDSQFVAVPCAGIVPDVLPSPTAAAYVRKCIAENHFPSPIKEIVIETFYNRYLQEDFKTWRDGLRSMEEGKAYEEMRAAYNMEHPPPAKKQTKKAAEIRADSRNVLSNA